MMELLQIIIGFKLRHVLNSVDAGRNGTHDLVGWGDDCITEPFAAGLFDVALVSVIMFRGGVEVPPIDGMKCPSSTGIRFFVDLDIAAHRCQRHLVVVEWSIHVSIC